MRFEVILVRKTQNHNFNFKNKKMVSQNHELVKQMLHFICRQFHASANVCLKIFQQTVTIEYDEVVSRAIQLRLGLK